MKQNQVNEIIWAITLTGGFICYALESYLIGAFLCFLSLTYAIKMREFHGKN